MTTLRQKISEAGAKRSEDCDCRSGWHSATLRATIWLYFSVFTAVILILIWLFQVVTLDKYYELSKRRKISQVSDKIAAAFDESDPNSIDSIVEDLAYENSMTIAVTDWNGNPVSTADFMGGYSVITSDKSYILFGYRNELLASP